MGMGVYVSCDSLKFFPEIKWRIPKSVPHFESCGSRKNFPEKIFQFFKRVFQKKFQKKIVGFYKAL